MPARKTSLQDGRCAALPRVAGSALLASVVCNVALARNELAAATRTTLYVATWNMELTFDAATIVAWLAICAPVVSFATITNAIMENVGNANDRNLLRSFNLFGPTLHHADPVVDDSLFGHEISSADRQR
jgi:hypothetical protein